MPLGHGRFRGLRLWIVLRLYGAERLRALMRHRLALMDFLADQVGELLRGELYRWPWVVGSVSAATVGNWYAPCQGLMRREQRPKLGALPAGGGRRAL